MKKIFLSIVFLLLMSISIIGCTGNAKEPSSLQLLKTITVGKIPDLDSLPFIIAQHNGYFEEEGIEVKLEHFKSAADRYTALQTKKNSRSNIRYACSSIF